MPIDAGKFKFIDRTVTLMLSTTVDLVLAAVALGAAVSVGIVVHELSHVTALSLFGVPCAITVLPDRDQSGVLDASAPGAWATVTPTAIPPGFSPWRLRAAAMMPLCLLVPLVLGFLGVVPNPFGGSLPLQVAALGWLGCALPSPQDFSLLWYPDEALDDLHRDASS